MCSVVVNTQKAVIQLNQEENDIFKIKEGVYDFTVQEAYFIAGSKKIDI